MSDMRGDAWSVLPPEILQRVVSLLPLVPLFRCRAVCKQWNAWISELHPQTPDQKTEILLIPHKREESHPRYWVVLDTSMDKWYYIDSKHLKGKRIDRTVLAAHGGLVCVRQEPSRGLPLVVILNPVTKEYWEIPKFMMCDYRLVVDNNTNNYKLYATIKNANCRPDSDFQVQMYDSNDAVWRDLGVIPDMSDCTGSMFNFIAVYGDFVHILCVFHEGGDKRLGYILSYNMKEDSWFRRGRSDIPLFLRKDIRTLNLLMNGSQLLLVGATSKNEFHGRIFIWDISIGRNEAPLIAEMPPSLCKSLQTNILTIYSHDVRACGYGNRIFFLHQRTCKVVIYSISDDSWHCPTNMGTRETLPRFVRCAPFDKFMTLILGCDCIY